MARISKGFKWGVIVGATAGLLSSKKNRHEIAKKLKLLAAELEKQAAAYRQQWPKTARQVSITSRKLTASAKDLGRELTSAVRHFDSTGEKVKSEVAKDTKKLVTDVATVISRLKAETKRLTDKPRKRR